MRKVIVNNIVSLDGFYSDADGNPLVLNMDEVFDRANLETFEGADFVLLGRDSFDGFSAYWPSIADAPEQPADSPTAKQFDETNRAISRRWQSVPKVVVTNSSPIPEDNALYSSTTSLRRDEVAGWLDGVRDGGDGSIAVFGSRVMWNGLLAQGLVDEVHLMISPTVLTIGNPLFTAPASLDLIDARTFDGSRNVQLRYAVQKP